MDFVQKVWKPNHLEYMVYDRIRVKSNDWTLPGPNG
jgi:hypothetical protein